MVTPGLVICMTPFPTLEAKCKAYGLCPPAGISLLPRLPSLIRLYRDVIFHYLFTTPLEFLCSGCAGPLGPLGDLQLAPLGPSSLARTLSLCRQLPLTTSGS